MWLKTLLRLSLRTWVMIWESEGWWEGGGQKQANNCLFSHSEQKRGTQCIFPTVFAFYSLFADRSVTIFFTVFEPSAWITIKTRLKQGKKTVSSTATCLGTEGNTCRNGNQNNNRWKLEWFVYKVTNKNNKKREYLVRVWLWIWHHEGHLRSKWEEWWHTNTHIHTKAGLIGTCRTGMHEECQLTSLPSRHRGQQPRLLCQHQQSGERLRANCGASGPSGLHAKVLVTHSESQWRWRVTHINFSLKNSNLGFIWDLVSVL